MHRFSEVTFWSVKICALAKWYFCKKKMANMQKMPCFCRKIGRVKLKKTKTKRFPSRKPLLDLVEVTGFEPATFWSRTKRATKLRYTSIYGANEGTRTPDLLITNRLLYQLSHIGITRLAPKLQHKAADI